MSDIAKIDKNFEIKTEIGSELIYHSVLNAPFSLHGLLHDGEMYRRMPRAVADSVNPGVAGLHRHTAGGRVRFITNSPKVAFKARMHNVGKMPHFAFSGSAGFDVYERVDGELRFIKGLVPPIAIEDGYSGTIDLGETKTRELLFNFPQYAGVYDLEIGINEGATLEAPAPYTVEKPIVFYGSSITQGACATRPGNSYENILSREFDFDYVNLGFSGHAKGEENMARYIAGLDMSAFVYDYDYNAPNPEHLERTHEPMFKIIREAHPDLPIIIMSRPTYTPDGEWRRRLEIITQTYENAKKSGDKNVYLITGKELTEISKYDTTVDTVHPTDFGFYSISVALSKVFKKIFNK